MEIPPKGDRLIGSKLFLSGIRRGGAQPEAKLIDAKGALYGTTHAGGIHGLGTKLALKIKH